MNHTANRKLLKSLRLNGRYSYPADDFGTLLVENGAQIVEEDNNRHSMGLGLLLTRSGTINDDKFQFSI